MRNIVIIAFIAATLMPLGQISASAAPVNSTTKASPDLPKGSDITSISMTGDTPAQVYWQPKNPANVKSEIMGWLKQAQPTAVHSLPREVIPHLEDYLGPAHLYLKASNQQTITIWPVYYLSFKSTQDGNYQYFVHYVNNVVAWTQGNKSSFLFAPVLFRWLQQDQWMHEFKQN